MPQLNETHDPALRSWVASAQEPGCDFPLQNLPHAVFRRVGSNEPWRGGVAIGDQVLDLAAALTSGAFDAVPAAAREALADAALPALNALMARSPEDWSALRLALSRALREGAAAQARLAPALVPQAQVEYTVPARIGDYTDFYTSVHHATNIGRLFRPDQPLMPNYKWVPIGYHGRASTIGVSGQAFMRPQGQTLPAGATRPAFGPCQRLDYELELGLYIGAANAPGEPIAIGQAERHLFGICLLNDWSARDIQAWEYQPLGPFLSKNFATTVSPWVVTLEALAPFRVPFVRPDEDPQPLPYLDDAEQRRAGALDIQLEVWLETTTSRGAGRGAMRLSRTSYRHAYWTPAQLVAHHSVNGCALQPGDLLGTGTLSGPTPGEAGALIELTRGGREPLALPDGSTRTFLQDGDAVILRGWCEAPGAVRVGFGECRGCVLPARALSG
ncbi:MAG: fumarylacetoacetase [Aquabacterium sp.]|nr:fumarylacetoacetase [Aquabacterium sp.]